MLRRTLLLLGCCVLVAATTATVAGADSSTPPVSPTPPRQPGGPPLDRVIVQRDRILLLDKIYFETGRATIKPISFPLLAAIAAQLQAHTEVDAVEIQVHTDPRGDAGWNLRLSDERAQAVRRDLIALGVQERRLVGRGYGETRPLCGNATEACWASSRRVELWIIHPPPTHETR